MVKNPIQTQKVYVTMTSVLELQKKFTEQVAYANRLYETNIKFHEAHPEAQPSPPNLYKCNARGMAQVIRILGLPIGIPNGF